MPRTSSLRSRLGRALFGYTDATEDEQGTLTGEQRTSGSRRSEDDPPASLQAHSDSRTASVAKPIPIKSSSTSVSEISSGSQMADADDTLADAAEKTSSSSVEKCHESGSQSSQPYLPPLPASTTASNKRRSLHALLSTSLEDKSSHAGALQGGGIASAAKERVPQQPSAAHRKSSSGEERVMQIPRQAGESFISTSTNRAKPSPASALSTSLTQGVKTLSERYMSSKEASETFKTMRERVEPRSPSPMLLPDRGTIPRGSLDSSRRTMPDHKRSSSGTTSHKSAEPRSDDIRPAASTVSSDVSTMSTPVQDVAHTLPSASAKSESVQIPDQLLKGEVMLKVTSKKVMQRVVRIDADAGQILWDSKKNNRVNLEAIRQVRTGPDARSYRTSLSIAATHEQRWLSIIYQVAGAYKALHLIALSDASLRRWRETLDSVQSEQKMLASCVDMMSQRQSLWLRQQFKGADESKDSRLDFDEVVKLCRRLGIMSNQADLRKQFEEADKERIGYLDFGNFQHFVTLLKRRKDIEALFDTWADVEPNEEAPTERNLSMTDARDPSLCDRVGASMSKSRFLEFLQREQGHSDVPMSAVTEVFDKFCGERKTVLDRDGFLAFLTSSDNSILSDQSSLALSRGQRIALETSVAAQEIRSHAETAEELIAISGQRRVTQDMTRPLAEYFISSSHNTYLVGGQLTGESTVEGYIRALIQGARSVELDCWDGQGNEPVVTHGHTLTSKVPFRDVIQAIGRYAFVSSPYPLILSLEVHNDLAQQDVVAQILKTVLGDKLLVKPLSDNASGSLQALPSPQQLMGKILVKAKNLLLHKASQNPERFELVVNERSATSTSDTTESENDGILHNARDLVRSVAKGRKGRGRGDEQKAFGDNKATMSPSLASLLIYTIGVKHRGINKKETYATEHMISLSERTALKYAKSAVGGPNREDLIKHNRTHLTRIYPSMHSFARLRNSANFLPCQFWSMGCQLVALNWQTLDLGYEMNQAMFARNGRSGYVLKPDALRRKDILQRTTIDEKIVPSAAQHVMVQITIISAQQLPRSRDAMSNKLGESDAQGREGGSPVLDPFVSVAVVVPDTAQSFGVTAVSQQLQEGLSSSQLEGRTIASTKSDKFAGRADCSKPEVLERPAAVPATASKAAAKARSTSRLRTSTVRQNGFNPIWNETLTFRIRLPTSSSAISSGETSTSILKADLRDDNLHRATRGLLDLCFVRFEVRNGSKRETGGNSSGNNSSATTTTAQASAAPRPNVSPTPSTDTKGSSQSATSVASVGSQAPDPATRAANAKLQGSDAEVNEDSPSLATYMISIGAMEQGYHHIPLYDGSMAQHLFSTLFVRTKVLLASDQ